jgi:recombinational DNA repair protein (RecF pathway)
VLRLPKEITMNRNILAAALLAASAFTSAAHAQAAPDGRQQGLTRAEVVADFIIYRESGLELLNEADAVNFYSPEYLQAKARYQALRSSSYYAELVQKVTAQRHG